MTNGSPDSTWETGCCDFWCKQKPAFDFDCVTNNMLNDETTTLILLMPANGYCNVSDVWHTFH